MKRIITFSLDADLVDQIRAMAEAENRSVSNYVEYLLLKAIADIS